MHRLILAHVPADDAEARYFCVQLQEYAPLAMGLRAGGPDLQIGAGALLGVVWSRKTAAAPEAAALIQLAQRASGAVLLRADAAPLPDALAALRLVEIPVGAEANKTAAALRFAHRLAGRPQAPAPIARRETPQIGAAAAGPVATHAARKVSYTKIFAGGVGRGFMSSFAVLSLGAGAAVGVQANAGAIASFSLDGVARWGATEASADEINTDRGLISETELARQAGALRQAAAAEHVQITERLDVAEQQLAEARLRTDATIARLAALSADFGVAKAVPVTFTVAHAAAPAPAPTRVAAAAPAAAPATRFTPVSYTPTPSPLDHVAAQPAPAAEPSHRLRSISAARRAPMRIAHLTTLQPIAAAEPAADLHTLADYVGRLQPDRAHVQAEGLELWSPG